MSPCSPNVYLQCFYGYNSTQSRPIRLYFIMHDIVFAMRNDLQCSTAKLFRYCYCFTLQYMIKQSIWSDETAWLSAYRYKYGCSLPISVFHQIDFMALLITRLPSKREVPRSNPTVDKNFLFGNSGLLHQPHSSTKQMQMNSTVVYT